MEPLVSLCLSGVRYGENFFFELCVLFLQIDDKKFVVKAIPQAMNSDEKNATNREVDILKGLVHPNIVR